MASRSQGVDTSQRNCCDDSEVPGDPRNGHPNTFKTTMCDAPCNDPLCCVAACFCFPCSQFVLRQRVLGGDMTKYRCCQGYFDVCCFKAGCYGEESCPHLCLCLESFCFHCLAISASRMYVMDMKGLQSDPCDRRLIRFNNCVQCLSCICSLVACITGYCREGAHLLRLFADCVYCTIASCMTAQVNYEMSEQFQPGNPKQQLMSDSTG